MTAQGMARDSAETEGLRSLRTAKPGGEAMRQGAAAHEPLDIQQLNRADIVKRDWESVHIAGDRAPAFLWERVKRTWIR
jgi:hypothetical protein